MLDNFKSIASKWSITHWVIRFLKKIRFKQYDNVNLYQVLRIFIDKVVNDDILHHGYAVAYNFTLAIFPAVIFLFTLIPFVHNFIPEVDNEKILEFIGEVMPSSMFEQVESTIFDILSNTRGGLLTFGAVFALYLAANGVQTLMQAFNSCYKTVEKRGYIKTRLIAIGLTLMLAFSLIFAILLLVVGSVIIEVVNNIEWLDIDQYTVFLLLILRFVVMFIVYYLAVSFIYYFGPSVHYNWRFFSFGSMLSTLLGLAASYGFSYYITSFGTYNKLYGSIGVLIALMIWQLILTVILLIGYELNASFHMAHRTLGENLISPPHPARSLPLENE